MFKKSKKNINKKSKKIKVIKNNLKSFIKEEKREVRELVSGKQNFFRYWRDSSFLFKEYFVPGDHNNNKPKILRPKQLTIIAVFLVFVKIILASYIFIIYQKEAEMSENIVNQVFFLTNEERLSNDVGRLSLNSGLTKAAYAKANDMMVAGYFSHTSLDGRRPWDFVNRSEYAYILIGENLAMNFISASGAHTALMASPSHQKNILNPKYTDVGLAVVNGEINGKNTNILVQMFGAKTVVSEGTDSRVETPVENITPSPSPIQEPSVIVRAEEKDIAPTPTDNKPEPVKTEPVKTEPVKTEPVKTEPVKTEPLSPTPVKNEIEYNPQESNEEELSTVSSGTLSNIQTETLPEEDFILYNNDLSVVPYLNAWDDFSVESIAEGEASVSMASSEQVNKGYKFIQISKIIYAIFLITLIIALIINIIVRITVQHKSVIVQTLLLIVLIAGLFFLDFGFINEIKEAAKNITVL
jgi:hypothetical protein